MRKVSHNLLFFLIISLVIFVSWFSQAPDFQTSWVKTAVASDTFTGKVVVVPDGDTISVMRGGKAEEVRLYGIDCPEGKQAFGAKAKKYTSEMSFGKEVTVQIKTTDRYGRTAFGVAER